MGCYVAVVIAHRHGFMESALERIRVPSNARMRDMIGYYLLEYVTFTRGP